MKRYDYLVYSLVIILALLLFSQCVPGPRYSMVGAYEIQYGTCPVHPNTKHYRKVGKQFDPSKCNFVNK